MLNTIMADRLRVWRPVLSPEDIEASKVALVQGIERMRAEGGAELPSPRDLIWWLMQEAAETWRRLPDKERAWGLYKVMWPELARPSEECRQVEDQIKNEMGIEKLRETSKLVMLRTIQDPLPRLTITDPSAVDRAVIVYTWLRFVKAKNLRGTKAAFIALAEGRGTKIAAQELGRRVGESAIHKLKYKVLADIEAGLNKCIEHSRKFL
jgi:hypothetical protein